MKNLRAAIALSILLFLFCGLVFPLIITGIAQTTMPYQAGGSLVREGSKIVGSDLIGQSFQGPGYFHSRPSAAGAGYDANSSSGTNLGPTNPKLLKGAEGFDGVEQLAKKYREINGLNENEKIPSDAVTRSASGLDPHISPRNAQLQMSRVAKHRGVPMESVNSIIRGATENSLVGIFGEPRVNVLKANIALNALQSKQ